jgi:hypothetical protein
MALDKALTAPRRSSTSKSIQNRLAPTFDSAKSDQNGFSRPAVSSVKTAASTSTRNAENPMKKETTCVASAFAHRIAKFRLKLLRLRVASNFSTQVASNFSTKLALKDLRLRLGELWNTPVTVGLNS